MQRLSADWTAEATENIVKCWLVNIVNAIGEHSLVSHVLLEALISSLPCSNLLQIVQP